MADKETKGLAPNPPASWGVKGVDPRVRSIASDLARRSGMSLGEWLNLMILELEEAGETNRLSSVQNFWRQSSFPNNSALRTSLHADLQTISPTFHTEATGAKSASRVLIVWSYAFDLLGGRKVLEREIQTSLDAHELLEVGLPARALTHLVDRVALLHVPSNFERAVGMSQRTLQRRRETLHSALNPEQSGRAWKFAELVDRATGVFGSQDRAEQWIAEPAIGLNQKAPLDLLSTAAGQEAVEEYLGRLEYGVYA